MVGGPGRAGWQPEPARSSHLVTRLYVGGHRQVRRDRSHDVRSVADPPMTGWKAPSLLVFVFGRDHTHILPPSAEAASEAAAEIVAMALLVMVPSVSQRPATIGTMYVVPRTRRRLCTPAVCQVTRIPVPAAYWAAPLEVTVEPWVIDQAPLRAPDVASMRSPPAGGVMVTPFGMYGAQLMKNVRRAVVNVAGLRLVVKNVETPPPTTGPPVQTKRTRAIVAITGGYTRYEI